MSSQNKKDNEESDRNIQKMALLLREGNTLLSDACPQCNSPLFKMKSGDIYCASCDKKVIIVKGDEEIDNIMHNKPYLIFKPLIYRKEFTKCRLLDLGKLLL